MLAAEMASWRVPAKILRPPGYNPSLQQKLLPKGEQTT
jgi:hypothetical protein